jgi:hypothetical protein
MLENVALGYTARGPYFEKFVAVLRGEPQTIHRLSYTDRPSSHNVCAYSMLLNTKICD